MLQDPVIGSGAGNSHECHAINMVPPRVCASDHSTSFGGLPHHLRSVSSACYNGAAAAAAAANDDGATDERHSLISVCHAVALQSWPPLSPFADSSAPPPSPLALSPAPRSSLILGTSGPSSGDLQEDGRVSADGPAAGGDSKVISESPATPQVAATAAKEILLSIDRLQTTCSSTLSDPGSASNA